MSDSFYVEITTGTRRLTVAEIWPDGDAPDNPTAEDVKQEMNASGPLAYVISDWGFESDLHINVGAAT